MPYNPNIHHRRSIRLKGYDYSQAGLYFITICCQNRICRFGKIENGAMILNEYGQIAFDEWMKTPNIRSNIQLDAFVVMPNHIHGIIVITDTGTGVSHTPLNGTNVLHTPICDTPLSVTGVCDKNRGVCDKNRGVCDTNRGVCDTNRGVCDTNRGVCDTPLRSPSHTVGAIVRGYKSAVTKQIGYSVWHRNYHEHIIRNEKSYQRIANYIVNNPVNWKNDKFHMVWHEKNKQEK